MKFLIISVILFTVYENIQSARILGIIPTPAHSHQSVFQPIWKALAQKGHDLVVVTSNPMNDPGLPNLKEIDISFSYEIKNQHLANIIKDKHVGLSMFQAYADIITSLTIRQFEDPGIQDLIYNSSLHFDLVMYEYSGSVFGAFAHKFNCPSIGLLSLELLSDQKDILGNPQHPSLSPLLFLPVYKDLNIYERLQSTILHYAWPMFNKILFKNQFDKIINKYFGEGYPSTESFNKNVDMVFANTNKVFKIPMPISPNVIEFGEGVHIKEPKPLPTDIEKFLNSSKHGVIYFSLGSNIKSEFVNDKLKKVILETFTSLPYDVLWKFEEELVKDNPRIKIVKWTPQQDILRHPNIKLFISQCGLQSLEEALYSHVPVIGLPFFGDQPRNARMIEYLGIGKYFNYDELEVAIFKQAIIAVASDPTYKTKMEELARLSKDKPMNGIDSVVWWTEYVIRNNGAKHLRSVLIDFPWYQYYMLDVFGCIMVVLLTTLFVIYTLCKQLYKLIRFSCRLGKAKKVKAQ